LAATDLATIAFQHFLIDIGEFLDIETALPGRMLAELREQAVIVIDPQAIKNCCGLAG
jgi:hypothetical protein